MRVISLNVNGLRSAARKGALGWLAESGADLVCVQELKAQPEDLEAPLRSLTSAAGRMGSVVHCAEQRGYSGVGIYSYVAPSSTEAGMGVAEFDREGRILRADFDAGLSQGGPPVTVVSLYAPSGSASEDRQAAKFRFLAVFLPLLRRWFAEYRQTGREFLICGDWNIAHTERDLKNWKGNLKNSGFLPEERAWMTEVFSAVGWVDVYRRLYPNEEAAAYTWWSNRGQARANNVGWRIDYQVATPGLAARAQNAFVFRDQSFSDHAPLVVDYQ
ncbi:MAG: exodeoxyribonuclease [Pseudomonadota bacterium]|jgi:exodeoxyribonuclease-3